MILWEKNFSSWRRLFVYQNIFTDFSRYQAHTVPQLEPLEAQLFKQTVSNKN